MSFKAGQKIQVIKIGKGDWWIGLTTEDGRRGHFPINFMQHDD